MRKMTFALYFYAPNLWPHKWTNQVMDFWQPRSLLDYQSGASLVCRWFCASLWNAFCATVHLREWLSFSSCLLASRKQTKLNLTKKRLILKVMRRNLCLLFGKNLEEKYNSWLWRYKFPKEERWLKKIKV